jgi:hypothetical protein
LMGQWSSISAEQEGRFAKFRDRKHRIDKDVVRTDRQQALFAVEGSEGLKALHRVLLTYTFFNFDLSYCQVKQNPSHNAPNPRSRSLNTEP